MEYILEKKGYNTLKISSNAYGTIPTTVSYERILDYIGDMVRRGVNLYDLSFKDHRLYIQKVEYEEKYSFINEEILIIDSSLEMDDRFMGPIRSFITEYQQSAAETRARIKIYRDSINKAAQKQRIRERANNEANHLIESYLENDKTDLTELADLAKPIYDALTEKSQNLRSCVSILPTKDTIKSPLLSSKLLKTGCYVACGATFATLLYGLNVYDVTPIPIICSLIPAVIAFDFNLAFKSHDRKKIAEAIRCIKKGIEKNYSLVEEPATEEETFKDKQEEKRTIVQPTATVVKDTYLNLIESLLTYIKNHPDIDYTNESAVLHQLSEYYYNAKKAEIKNGPAVAIVPFMQDLATQEISIYSKNRDYRIPPTESINVNGEILKNRLLFLGLSEIAIKADYHIKQAFTAIDDILNDSYAGCEADIIRIFSLVYTYAEKKNNSPEELDRAGLALLKGIRDIEQEIKLNHLEADYSIVSSSSSVVVDDVENTKASKDKGLKKAYPSEI